MGNYSLQLLHLTQTHPQIHPARNDVSPPQQVARRDKTENIYYNIIQFVHYEIIQRKFYLEFGDIKWMVFSIDCDCSFLTKVKKRFLPTAFDHKIIGNKFLFNIVITSKQRYFKNHIHNVPHEKETYQWTNLLLVRE